MDPVLNQERFDGPVDERTASDRGCMAYASKTNRQLQPKTLRRKVTGHFDRCPDDLTAPLNSKDYFCRFAEQYSLEPIKVGLFASLAVFPSLWCSIAREWIKIIVPPPSS